MADDGDDKPETGSRDGQAEKPNAIGRRAALAQKLMCSNAQIAGVAPALKQLLEDPYRPDTRAALNCSLWLSAVGILVVLGVVTLEKMNLEAADAKVHSNVLLGGIVFTLISGFFLLWFWFSAKRDAKLSNVATIESYKLLLEASEPLIAALDKGDADKKKAAEDTVLGRTSFDEFAEKAKNTDLKTNESLQPYYTYARYLNEAQ